MARWWDSEMISGSKGRRLWNILGLQAVCPNLMSTVPAEIVSN